MVPTKGRTFTTWSAEQDALLMQLGAHRINRQGWMAIAGRIPGRSASACRIRYYSLTAAAKAGPEAARTKERRSSASIYADAKASMQSPLPGLPKQVPFPIAVALILGDPLPGRSALDKMQRQNGASS